MSLRYLMFDFMGCGGAPWPVVYIVEYVCTSICPWWGLLLLLKHVSVSCCSRAPQFFSFFCFQFSLAGVAHLNGTDNKRRVLGLLQFGYYITSFGHHLGIWLHHYNNVWQRKIHDRSIRQVVNMSRVQLHILFEGKTQRQLTRNVGMNPSLHRKTVCTKHGCVVRAGHWTQRWRLATI